jgi:hypothetical protein
MLNTYTSYQSIARNLQTSLERVEKQPLVDRETKYYLENIIKVTSIEELVDNDRLFKYAMKAHGLEDMVYAKAFMVKALKEGITDPNSFANKLTDKRYADFVKSFNFVANGPEATVFVKAQQGAVTNYFKQAQIAGIDPRSETVRTETNYYLANIGKIKSLDEFMGNDRVLRYALAAFGLNDTADNKQLAREVLEGGVRDPESTANKMGDLRFLGFAMMFDFEALGEAATTYNPAQRPVVDKYMRQTLEQDAGAQNEGVRLALYFQRKAPTISSFYQVLGDPALAKVVRTALGLPDSFASANIDKQVQLFEARLDVKDFSDPEALGKFLTRFTSLWEIENPTSTAQSSLSVLFAQPVEYGVSTNLMLAIQKMRS